MNQTTTIPQRTADAEAFRAHLAEWQGFVACTAERVTGTSTVFTLAYEDGSSLWLVASAWGAKRALSA